MAIKFGFSDECGSYSQNRTVKQNKVHPYYIRSLFLIDGDDYRKLTNDFNSLKKEFGFSNQEIKWAHIWCLRNCQLNGKIPNVKDDYYFLKDVDYHKIIDFVEQSLKLLCNIENCKTVYTITNNSLNSKFSEKDLFKMHLTTLLQRTQFETQKCADDLAVLFFDPLCVNKSNLLREVYYDIQKKGDFIKEYTHIKDSLNLEFSHHSTGIQLSDFLSGVMAGVLKGYGKSVEIFNNTIRPTLRNYNHKILGAGICEIPTNQTERLRLKSHFDKHFLD